MLDEKMPYELLHAAVSASKNSYSPYSNFAVGAAVETIDGFIFIGTNMENASYGLTVCAEVGALQAALTEGKLDKINRIAIVGGKKDEQKGDYITPCGRCRQLILESAHLSSIDINVWCADLNLTSIHCFKISELLPFSFGPENLIDQNIVQLAIKHAHSK
jgi:cytidine deaminase